MFEIYDGQGWKGSVFQIVNWQNNKSSFVMFYFEKQSLNITLNVVFLLSHFNENSSISTMAYWEETSTHDLES